MRHLVAHTLNVNGPLLWVINPIWMVDLVACAFAKNVGSYRVTPRLVIVNCPVLTIATALNVWMCDVMRTITETAVHLIAIVSGVVTILDVK